MASPETVSLTIVHPEDRVIVRNILIVIRALKQERILTDFSVDEVPSQNSYIINAYIQDGVDFELSKAELDTIHDVNPLRVLSASVARVGGKLRLRIRVSNRDEPIMLTETQVHMTVRKRSRWAK